MSVKICGPAVIKINGKVIELDDAEILHDKTRLRFIVGARTIYTGEWCAISRRGLLRPYRASGTPPVGTAYNTLRRGTTVVLEAGFIRPLPEPESKSVSFTCKIIGGGFK